MHRLTLTEFQTLAACKLTPEACDTLRVAVPSLRVEPTRGAPARYDLTPGSWVGAVSVGSLDVVIQPKIPIDRLLFLISYALDPHGWRDIPFDFEADASVVDAIVPAFVHHIRRAVRRGLLQQYRHDEDALPVLRGRLQLHVHVNRRFAIAPPVDVSFDEFTEDHLLHQLIKAALIRLERSAIRSEYARRLLHRTLPLFENVQVVPFDSRRLPSVAYTRLNAHYRAAVELARLIIKNSSFGHQHGAVSATAFIVDMNEVFETFVVSALRDALELPASTLVQGAAIEFDEDRQVTLRPDLTWWERGRPAFVGDVKYKALDARGYRHADLYQLLAYSVATDLPGGLLIYAKGEGTPGKYQVAHAGRTLEVRWLDVAGNPEDILMSVSEMAMVIRRLHAQGAQQHAGEARLRVLAGMRLRDQ